MTFVMFIFPYKGFMVISVIKYMHFRGVITFVELN